VKELEMKTWILEKQAKIEEKPLRLMEVSAPHPKDNEIRIKIYACGVCRTDIHIAEGDLPSRKSPLILGHEIVGVVDEAGKDVRNFKIGKRAGVAWLNYACGKCKFCLSGRENLCPSAKFTGWNVDGGYAEYTTVPANFALHLGENLSFVELAPLMCPGIAGYRAFRLTQIQKGQKLGLYGFGPTASYVLQVAKFLGVETFVITRSEKNRNAAKEVGADWVGSYEDKLPCKLDADIIFPPAGNLVEIALSQLDSGGRLVLAPVTNTPIEIKDYNHIWMERSIISLANISRKDGVEFLEIADEINIKTKLETFDFNELSEVLIRVKRGKVDGNAVIRVAE
jgi:zinc-binding alcohol dehydrogenase family protein